MATWTQVATKHGMAPWVGSGLTVSVDSITDEPIILARITFCEKHCDVM